MPEGRGPAGGACHTRARGAMFTYFKNRYDARIQAHKLEILGRLAGGIAHDFNNLLTAIRGYNQMMLEEAADEPRLLEYAEEVRNAVDRASTLTGQLLAFSRRDPVRQTVLDLNEAVRGIDRMLRRLLGRNVELVTRLAPELPRLKAGPGQIDQVIVNLAVNAREAMPAGGRLMIETAGVLRNGRRCVMLSISDDGQGMSAATKARLFEPFFTTKGRGTGLGLSIVRGIVKRNGGEIFVDSEPGRGAAFRIYLPAVD